jgi:hypothetical protein
LLFVVTDGGVIIGIQDYRGVVVNHDSVELDGLKFPRRPVPIGMDDVAVPATGVGDVGTLLGV